MPTCSSKAAIQSIINPDWDFNKMGIGGLDKEFSAIFRRAFASRVFPPEIVAQLGESVVANSVRRSVQRCLGCFE